MKAKYRILCLIVFAALVAMAYAQTTAPAPGNEAAPPSAAAQLSEADLQKLVAPIALYPDPLLATLLPASAYPLDIVKAARFIKDTNNIPKVDSQPWDSNVKALAHFPDVLNKMNDDIDWTSDLGDAFVNNQKGVMNAIQVMRNKAHDVGNLKTTPQQVVTVTNDVVQQTVNQQVVVVTNTIVQIQPASPQVIYVPQYNPTVVYAAPTPMAYAAPFISFGAGMMWGAAIANNCNWHSGGVYHGNVNVNNNFNRNVNVNQNFNRNNAQVNRNWNNNATRANQNWNNQNFGQNNGRSGGSAGSGNFNNNQKWQANPNRGTSSSSASQASRGWGGAGNTGGGDAFNNFGGGSQTRAASQRGAGSFGGSGNFSGGGRSAGGFRGGGGGRGGGRR